MFEDLELANSEYEKLKTKYDELVIAKNGADEKIKEFEEGNKNYETEIQRLKIKNYELFEQVTNSNSQSNSNNQQDGDGDDNINIEHNFVDESEIEINKNDVPIFENGPGVSQVELWKKQYTQEKVFHVQIIDRDFIFRTLNRFEYKQIVAIENIDALYREELICKTCVLFPYNYDIKTMAAEDSGYPSTLAQIIMENSGFTKEYGIEVL